MSPSGGLQTRAQREQKKKRVKRRVGGYSTESERRRLDRKLGGQSIAVTVAFAVTIAAAIAAAMSVDELRKSGVSTDRIMICASRRRRAAASESGRRATSGEQQAARGSNAKTCCARADYMRQHAPPPHRSANGAH